MRAMPKASPPTPAPSAELVRLTRENEALRRELRVMRIQLGELERLADSDTLTPLLNRRAFLREVERSLARVARHGGSTVVMIADLDGLKAINDTAGHQAGDGALIQVAHCLSAQLRGSDLVARIGGDEFGLILEMVKPEDAAAKARALAECVAREVSDDGPLAISIGFATIVADDTIDSVMARADAAMYAQKRQRSAR